MNNDPFTLDMFDSSALSSGLGLGVTLVPQSMQQMPDIIQKVFATPITLSGISAILLSLLIPERAGKTIDA